MVADALSETCPFDRHALIRYLSLYVFEKKKESKKREANVEAKKYQVKRH